MKQLLDYSNLTEDQKDVVYEIADILSTSGNDLLATFIMQKFFIEPKEEYAWDRELWDHLEKTYNIVGVKQGVSEENGIEYPIFSVTADVRVFETMWKDLKREDS
jgi:hypothetical protein